MKNQNLIKAEFLHKCQEFAATPHCFRTIMRKLKLHESKKIENYKKWVNAYHAGVVRKEKKEQLKKESKYFGMSMTEYEKLQIIASEFLKSFNDGYSMGSYKELYLKGKSTPFQHVDERQYYANSCQWKETHGEVIITITKVELKQLRIENGYWRTDKHVFKQHGKHCRYFFTKELI